MRKILRALSALALVAGLLGGAVPTATATSEYIRVHEDTDLSGDSCTFLPNGSDLGGWPDLQAQDCGLILGICNRGLLIGSGWDNCISSYAYALPPLRCVSLYQGYYYGGSVWTMKNTSSTNWQTGVWNTLISGWNDTISSMRYGIWRVVPRTGGYCAY
jgi:hypothetical protein